MRPIPNPEDMSAAERAAVYGPRRAAAPARAYAEPRPARRTQPRRREAASSYAPPPMIRAEPVRPAARPAPVAKAPAPKAAAPKAAAAKAPVPAAKPVPMAKAPAPAAPKPAAPKAPAVAANKPVPTPPAAAAAQKPSAAQGKLGQLQTAVGGAVARGAALTVGPEIAQGKPGQVSLSLPASLLDTLKAEAAKLGLTREARKAEVKATLSGDGYAVTPNGQQTAALKAGEAVRFDWQVAPGAQAKGPLTADVDAVLTGRAKPQTLSLASIQSAVAVAADAAKPKSGFKFPTLPDFGKNLPNFGKDLPNLGNNKSAEAPGAPPEADAAGDTTGPQPLLRDRTLPVVGKVSGRTQGAALLVVLAVVILSAVSSNMSKRRRLAERRRRYRTFQPLDERPVEA